MVNECGQLYTIEGVAAGLIMLLTAYFVLNSTAVYTPGDAHISDMQLEILGKDALNIMDTRPDSTADKSPLQLIIEHDRREDFKTMFWNLTNNRTLGSRDHVNFTANISYYNIATAALPPQDPIQSEYFAEGRRLTGGEHAVRATKWVIVDKTLPGYGPKTERAVLVEVLLWRD
jgi:hypothetical protein